MYSHDNQNIEISYGDKTTITFEFFKEKNQPKPLNENVTLTVKKNIGDVNAKIFKTFSCQDSNKAIFTFDPDDFQNLTTGLYFYDLFLENSMFTPFAPKQFNVKEIVHDAG